MTPEQAREPVEKFRSQVAEISGQLEALESYHVRDRNSREYVVNVKRHDDFVEIEDVLDLVGRARPLSDGAKEWVRNDIKMEQIWTSWLEIEREYVMQGLFGGMNLWGDGYWEEIKQMIHRGEDVQYPTLVNLGTKEERLALVDQWQQSGALARSYLQLLNKFEPDWCGRQGGYLYLGGAYQELDEYQSDLQERFESLDEVITTLQDLGETPPGSFSEEVEIASGKKNAEQFYHETMEELTTLVREYDNLATAVLWFMELVNDYNKGMSFQAEVVMRVEDALDDAKHHDILIYQDEVEKQAAEQEAEDARQVEISSLEERDKWDGQLYRYNDREGNFMALLFYPRGSPGPYGESEVFVIELPDEHVLEFTDWLLAKRASCLAADQRRRDEEAADDAAMEGY